MALTTFVPTAIPQVTSHVVNGFSTDITGVQFPLQSGVPLQNLYMFKVVPTAISGTCVAQDQPITAHVPLILNVGSTGAAPNIISKPIIINNAYFTEKVGILLDCERCITITSDSAAVADVTITIKGLDYLDNYIESTVVLANGTTSINLLNPLSVIAEITCNIDPGSNVSVGNTNIIGLPYYLLSTEFVVSAYFGATALDDTHITPAYNWRVNNPSLTQYPNRGTIDTGGSNPNGSTMLLCTYYVMGSDSEISAEINNLNQSSKKIVSVQNNNSGRAVLPYITPYDLTGVVYPEDLVFINNYISAKLS